MITEDLCHMLIEPLDLVTCRKSEVFRFLVTKDRDLLSLVVNPLRRSHRHLAFRTEGCHCIVGCVCVPRSRQILRLSTQTLWSWLAPARGDGEFSQKSKWLKRDSSKLSLMSSVLKDVHLFTRAKTLVPYFLAFLGISWQGGTASIILTS